MLDLATVHGLDSGIRETVKWLDSLGFDTVDSGDGVTKFTDAYRDNPFNYNLHAPHVFMKVAPGRIDSEEARLRAEVSSQLGKMPFSIKRIDYSDYSILELWYVSDTVLNAIWYG